MIGWFVTLVSNHRMTAFAPAHACTPWARKPRTVLALAQVHMDTLQKFSGSDSESWLAGWSWAAGREAGPHGPPCLESADPLGDGNACPGH